MVPPGYNIPSTIAALVGFNDLGTNLNCRPTHTRRLAYAYAVPDG